MKKLVLPFVIGIALGLGASTAAVKFLGRGDPSLTESLSAAVGSQPADSAAADTAHVQAADSVAPADSSVARLAAESTPVADTTVVGPSPALGGAMAMGTPQGSETQLDTTRLAELFGSMQARQAAAVLEHMDDYEVQVILGQLGNREAAAILSNLTPERAAVISRTVIRGERSTP